MPPVITLGDPTGDDWFRITYDLPDSFVQMQPLADMRAGVKGRTWAAGSQRSVRIFSRAAFQVPVRVEDPDEALRAAEVLATQRLAAVSAMTGSPTYGVPLAFHELGHPEEWLPRIGKAEVLLWNPLLLDADDVDPSTAGIFWAAQHDVTARRAAIDMHAGNVRSLSHGYDYADVQAALLSFFFVLERIANRVDRFYPQRPDPINQVGIIRDLEEALSGTYRLSDKLKAVHSANRDLKALQQLGLKRKVKEAGRVVGVTEAVRSTAGDFADLRNGTLGHVSADPQSLDDLVPWLDRAQNCSHEYLSAYLRWVADRGFAAKD
jgi:hypothetical protein